MDLGDRFYRDQIKYLGTCPGYKGKKKQRMAWDDKKKERAINSYIAEDPTPENSMEIVASIAEELDESPNGVRLILTKAGVYVKKNPASGTAKKAAGTGTARVSKEASQGRLNSAITDLGMEPNDEIISKLTGKAAVYFAELLEKK